MTSSPLTVLIFGHSFVRRLSSDLRSNVDAHAAELSDPLGDASIHLHGVGGRTVMTLRRYDLGAVSALRPDVSILEIGTNDPVANTGRKNRIYPSSKVEANLLQMPYLLRFVHICYVPVC